MGNWSDKVATIAAALFGAFLGLLGGWDATIGLLILAMVLDYLSGLALGFMNKSKKTPKGGLDSRIGTVGILKKALILVVVMIGAACDRLLGDKSAFRDMVIFFYIANEGLSILENVANAGIDVPLKIKNVLEQWKEKGNQEEELTNQDKNEKENTK